MLVLPTPLERLSSRFFTASPAQSGKHKAVVFDRCAATACEETIRRDSPEGYPQSRPYKWWNWHESYVPDAAPDPKWVEVSDAGEAAFRNLDAGAKA